MIKKLKKFLIELRKNQNLLKKKHEDTNYALKQVLSQQKLLNFLGPNYFSPTTGWTMTPQSILHCLNIIAINNPINIIEFGSGMATVAIAKLLKQQGKETKFWSVDSSQEWIDIVESQVKDLILDKEVNFIYSPLDNAPEKLCFKDQKKWHNAAAIREKINDITHFDLIIVDGPVGINTPFARFSAVPFLKDKINDKTIILLDDTNRPDENEIIKEWAKITNLKQHRFDRYTILSSDSNFDSTPYLLS